MIITILDNWLWTVCISNRSRMGLGSIIRSFLILEQSNNFWEWWKGAFIKQIFLKSKTRLNLWGEVNFWNFCEIAEVYLKICHEIFLCQICFNVPVTLKFMNILNCFIDRQSFWNWILCFITIWNKEIVSSTECWRSLWNTLQSWGWYSRSCWILCIPCPGCFKSWS